ncbi:shikimate dehydrogenase [Aureimonas ureilytica]|uniref:Shikimate dehydrogenase n=1 Tax=Aureimonas ureilytica TaxID=401562 RepID=A0A175RB65_9HYPH|nr:shikimate dehydrogenase [Aureimonas ureilytica]KTQ97070.1 shikimate dehydrogenase [Aureimonas ureilytica]
MPHKDDTSPTVRVGLIGSDIQLSKSPGLHETEGRALGLDYRYTLFDTHLPPFDAMSLPELLAHAEAQGFAGVNITHPFKQAVLPYLTGLSDDAAMLGAVNTVVFGQGNRTGHNTDWIGFFESFRAGLPGVALGSAVLLGAGGAGVAVAHAALKLGIGQLRIFDQDGARADALAEALNGRFGAGRAQAVRDVGAALAASDGLIHATPTGMPAHPGLPIEPDWLRPEHWVADIVYIPLVTELLALAEQRGCRTLPGGGMTVHQAAAAFALFCGHRPDAARMTRHFADLCRAG